MRSNNNNKSRKVACIDFGSLTSNKVIRKVIDTLTIQSSKIKSFCMMNTFLIHDYSPTFAVETLMGVIEL